MVVEDIMTITTIIITTITIKVTVIIIIEATVVRNKPIEIVEI